MIPSKGRDLISFRAIFFYDLLKATEFVLSIKACSSKAELFWKEHTLMTPVGKIHQHSMTFIFICQAVVRATLGFIKCKIWNCFSYLLHLATTELSNVDFVLN